METTTSSVRSGASGGDRSLLVDAVIGAVVTLALFFVPVVGTIVGGAVAGYLHERDGPKVGALSGFLAAIPAVLIVVLGFAFFAIVPDTVGAIGVGVAFVLVAIVAVLVAGAINAALGALGGYIGVAIRED